MATTGVLCGCPPAPPPAKRPRGRPRQHVDGCRACWRSLAADRDLPPPHDLSLTKRAGAAEIELQGARVSGDEWSDDEEGRDEGARRGSNHRPAARWRRCARRRAHAGARRRAAEPGGRRVGAARGGLPAADAPLRVARGAAWGARGRGVRGDGARGREFLERQHIFGMCVCVCVCLCRHSLRGGGRADRQPDVRAPGPGAARMILCGPRAARCASCCVAISRMRCRLIASRSEREPSGSALMRRRSHNTCDVLTPSRACS